jgi:hypothetical protein
MTKVWAMFMIVTVLGTDEGQVLPLDRFFATAHACQANADRWNHDWFKIAPPGRDHDVWYFCNRVEESDA